MRRLLLAGLCAALVSGCSVHRRGMRSVLPADLAGARPSIDESHRTVIDAERVRLTREYFAIHHPELARRLPAGDGPEVLGFEPRVVVVHWTAIPSLEGTLDVFAGLEISSDRPLVRRNGLLNVGIQFVVDRDGTIYGLYPETAMSRHVIGLNHVAIGIENVGDGDLKARRARAPLTSEQLASNIRLIRWLVGEYPTIEFVIGHSEYTDLENAKHPAHGLFHEELADYRTEKDDPGRRFLKALRRELKRAGRVR